MRTVSDTSGTHHIIRVPEGYKRDKECEKIFEDLKVKSKVLHNFLLIRFDSQKILGNIWRVVVTT